MHVFEVLCTHFLLFWRVFEDRTYIMFASRARSYRWAIGKGAVSIARSGYVEGAHPRYHRKEGRWIVYVGCGDDKVCSVESSIGAEGRERTNGTHSTVLSVTHTESFSVENPTGCFYIHTFNGRCCVATSPSLLCGTPWIAPSNYSVCAEPSPTVSVYKWFALVVYMKKKSCLMFVVDECISTERLLSLSVVAEFLYSSPPRLAFFPSRSPPPYIASQTVFPSCQ